MLKVSILEGENAPRGPELCIHQEIQVKVRRNQHFLVLPQSHQIFRDNSHRVSIRHMVTLLKHISSLKGFSPSINHPFNGLSVPNNKIANNSSTEHVPSVGYGHTVSPTSHGHIVSSGNILTVLDRQDQSIALDRQQWTLALAENNLHHSLQTAAMHIIANLKLIVICPNLYIMHCLRHRLPADIL